MLNQIHTWGRKLPSQAKPQEQQKVRPPQAFFWRLQGVWTDVAAWSYWKLTFMQLFFILHSLFHEASLFSTFIWGPSRHVACNVCRRRADGS